MSHVPPLYKNFGKGFKDLLEKKFDFNREVKVKTATLSGVTFETTARANSKSGDYLGALKTTYKRAGFGTLETDFNTEGSAKGSVEADQLRKDLTLKLSFEQPNTSAVEATLRREYLALSSGLTASGKHVDADGAFVLGFDGLFVGGAIKIDVGAQSLKDVNVGAEYAQPDFTVTVKTAEKADKVTASYLHNVNPETQVGAQFYYNIASSQRLGTSLALVGSYALDRDTTAKVKYSSEGVFTAALEQRLYNPKLKYGLAAEYALKNQSATPERFGLSISLGDA